MERVKPANCLHAGPPSVSDARARFLRAPCRFVAAVLCRRARTGIFSVRARRVGNENRRSVQRAEFVCAETIRVHATAVCEKAGRIFGGKSSAASVSHGFSSLLPFFDRSIVPTNDGPAPLLSESTLASFLQVLRFKTAERVSHVLYSDRVRKPDRSVRVVGTCSHAGRSTSLAGDATRSHLLTPAGPIRRPSAFGARLQSTRSERPFHVCLY